ncbi:hypothetical protein V5E97_15360 [Singulisphaera sp. Ch08]|uniref:Uncharacterized protein n=1 Tax=Singulisphaera sp. Ch08 TaxID=3120278 RepID=A0AAU7CPV1_9BACT
MAAWELANDPTTSPDLALRYAAAEVQFRTQVYNLSGILRAHPPEGPVVRLSDQAPIPVVMLLADIIRRDPRSIPHRSIDRELVHGAKELLCGISWKLCQEAD